MMKRKVGGGTRLAMSTWCPTLIALVLLMAGGACGITAQQLPLKTAPPAGAALICKGQGGDEGVPAPGIGDAEGAARLVSAATQAMLLGDLDGALEFLDRALLLDPAATEALYLQGRILQRLGASSDAAVALCRFLQVDPASPFAQEVRQRLDDARDQGVGRPLLETYRRGIALEQEGRLTEAEEAFTEFLSARPATAVALYNRALVRAALGHDQGARADLQHYLALEPGAADAVEVHRLLSFAITTPRPRPGTAFLTGALVPGGGQFYTGRPGLGAAITTLAGGALAAGMLYERTIIHCLDEQVGPCPGDQIASRETDTPWLVPGIGIAAGLALVAALEATIYASRHSQPRPSRPRPASLPGATGSMRLVPGGGIQYDGSALRLELARLRF
jgi:tetratricopeptide (TPR) repeat protein